MEDDEFQGLKGQTSPDNPSNHPPSSGDKWKSHNILFVIPFVMLFVLLAVYYFLFFVGGSEVSPIGEEGGLPIRTTNLPDSVSQSTSAADAGNDGIRCPKEYQPNPSSSDVRYFIMSDNPACWAEFCGKDPGEGSTLGVKSRDECFLAISTRLANYVDHQLAIDACGFISSQKLRDACIGYADEIVKDKPKQVQTSTTIPTKMIVSSAVREPNSALIKADRFLVEYYGRYSSSAGDRILNVTYFVENGTVTSCSGTYTTAMTEGTKTYPCDFRMIRNWSYNVPKKLITKIPEDGETSGEVRGGPAYYRWNIVSEQGLRLSTTSTTLPQSTTTTILKPPANTEL